MRLGRKLSEGFAVDQDADRAAAAQPAPTLEPAAPVVVEPDAFAAVWPEPARSGRRTEG